MSFKNVLLGLLSILILSFLACSSHTVKFDTQFNKLQGEMTPDQVSALLGPADLRELRDSKEFWHYKKGDDEGRVVIFDQGHVKSFGRDDGNPQVQPVIQAGVTPGYPPPLRTDLKIGESCTRDKECLSQNCHFKLCSGKNNCSADVGATCAVDTDCCSNFCDFGACRHRP